ncbi:MAG: L-seryl-tRNA(Sec) selenium transferase, partial [Firmicutes bacterium]|nr:L-seryl-tRNA(Sec) selenium transferase [Bacillota bacterium]
MRTLLALYPRQQVVGALRAALDEVRSNLLQGVMEGLSRGELVTLAVAEASDFLLALRTARLQPVINATGIILHTNLGRAVLPRKVIESISRIGCGYSNLEVDLATGKRGSRQAWVQELLKDLTGAEAALVVNNNAAAVWLCLNTLARDREVIVSRGEQVEIGGSFRIPDVIRQSGAKLVEVGTTNRT